MTSQRMTLLLVLPGALLAGLALRLPAQQATPTRTIYRPVQNVVTQYRSTTESAVAESQQLEQRVSAAFQKYQSAEAGADRDAAEGELRAALDEQFELLMTQREAQLADLRARLDKLAEQIQKRREAKQQIVDLRAKVLLNEAQGLGFYPEAGGHALDAGWPANALNSYPRDSLPTSPFVPPSSRTSQPPARSP